MARCSRCNACESMWDTSPCPHCGFPGKEMRPWWVRVMDWYYFLRNPV